MKYLKSVPEEKAFVLGNTRIRNLTELVKELYNMSDGAYSHYVSESHNYFADWIHHVVKHKELANRLRQTQDRKEAIKIIEKEIELLKKPKQEKTEKKEEKEEKVEAEEPLDSFVVSDPKAEKKQKQEKKPESPKKKKPVKTYDQQEVLRNIAQDEKEIKEFLWKHFAWDMAKEFMYGLAIGILVGFVLSKIFLRA